MKLKILDQLNTDDKTRGFIDSCILHYESIPSYKKVLSFMIKFDEMYKPIRKGPMYVDVSGRVAGENEWRSIKRAQIYMLERDLIETYDKKKGKRLVTTSRGHRIFYEDRPLAKIRDEGWDGEWTIVMYDVPERKRGRRNQLRKKLERLGFGSPQLSVMVSPLPIEKEINELIEGERMKNYTWVLRARNILGMENHQIVQKSWPIVAQIGNAYKLLLSAVEIIKQSKAQGLKEEWETIFIAVNSEDPYLPKELLPQDWAGFECEKLFKKSISWRNKIPLLGRI